MIIEAKLLDLEKEYNIHKLLRKNWDALTCLLVVFVLLAIGYQSPIFLAPFVILLMLYIIMDENYEQTSERNKIKSNYALRQNNTFELIQANTQDYMDNAEKVKNLKDRNTILNQDYIDYVNRRV